MANEQFLAERSRELLKNQLDSVDTNHSKVGTITSLSALFIPICFTVFERFDAGLFWIIVFFIPIVTNLVGVFYLVRGLFPNKYNDGINPTEFDNCLEKTPEEMYLFEIGINRDSISHNKDILTAHSKFTRIGIRFVFASAILFTFIFCVNLTVIKSNNMKETKEITNQSTTNTGSNSGGSSSSASGSGSKIPSTTPGQRNVLEKGGVPSGVPLEKK